MRRPSVKVSLYAIFAFIAALFAGLAYVSVDSSNRLNDSAQELSEHWLASVSTIDDLKSTYQDERLAVAKHLLSTTQAGMVQQEEILKTARAATETLLKRYQLRALSSLEQTSLQDFTQVGLEFDTVTERVLQLSRENKDDDAVTVFETELVPIATKRMAALDAIADFNDRGATAATDTADAIYASTSSISMTVIGLAALALLVSLVFVIRSIAGPIVAITTSMRTLAGGDVTTTIPFAGRTDELGSMAGAVEIFRKAAIANKQLELDAETNRKQAEANRLSDQARTEAEASERLRAATSGLADGLKRLSTGDLAFQLNDAFAPEFEALRHDFNSSVQQLADTLSAMSESISSMDEGTREISSGANDLSKRTEQQAASLEETAAALDQITVNVTNSAKRTEEARAVATAANQSAAKSADVVGQAEAAMGRIEASSQQISNIIGVIDEIAFQTNLLALNAGVEAARAGEAGRGFAVVAQEVRELAQRSAKAAKEIKGLILNSTTEVGSGVTLVRETGVALKTIGEQIASINLHMESIATSAKEQSTGLAEVNTAVNSMDQTTQQNAAMVEESTAASASLAQEAAKLRELVSHFTLQATANVGTSALRQTARAMADPVRRPASPAVRKPGTAARKVAGAGGSATAVAADWQEF